jgi:hypothetical protein
VTRTTPFTGVVGARRVSASKLCAGRGVQGLIAFVTILLLAFPALCLGAKEKKSSRIVTGVVSDGAENPIAGAAVVLTDLATGKKSATYATQEGTYQFTDLQPTHDYEVQATHQGVSSQVRRASSIDPRNRIVLNLRIPPPKEE